MESTSTDVEHLESRSSGSESPLDATETAEVQLDSDALGECGEHFAAGFFSDCNSPVLVRVARGVTSHLTHVRLPQWRGTRLYPGDREVGRHSSDLYSGHSAVRFHYTVPMQWDREQLKQKIEEASGRREQTLLALRDALQEYPYFCDLGGWIHASVNFRRILAEGLNSYAARIRARQADAQKSRQSDKLLFYDAMEMTLDGIRRFHARVVTMLAGLSGATDEEERMRKALLEALQRVPFEPAQTFYEAMVAENFIYYLDGCDGLGRFDQDLYPYYKADVEAGRITPMDALSLIEELWANIDCTRGWNVAIGGTAPDGTQGTNEVTRLCLEVARNRRGARPNLALRFREDTPEEIWQEAFRTLETGCGLPALYCEENYVRAIRDTHLGVLEEDLPDFAFGGCTELIVHGKSCCGGADTHLNLCRVLEKSIDTRLIGCRTFGEFFDRFSADLQVAVQTAADHTNRCYQQMAQWQPQPIRSLLIDDCIDQGIEYHAGGARYNWSVASVGGIGNVADSLQALREVVFEQRELSPGELIDILRNNFEGDERIQRRLSRCARYGNDEDAVDELAAKVAELAFRAFLARATWRGGRFVPACVLLNWYAMWGKDCGALPDGRGAEMPIGDSAGPVQGRDRRGPTAMLRSVAKLPHHLAPGTLVVNARFSKGLFKAPEAVRKLQDLVRSYFSLGGMQLQITVVDQETLKKALSAPEEYADLIVRIGGFSAYWHELSPDLRRTVIQRTEHM